MSFRHGYEFPDATIEAGRWGGSEHVEPTLAVSFGRPLPGFFTSARERVGEDVKEVTTNSPGKGYNLVSPSHGMAGRD